MGQSLDLREANEPVEIVDLPDDKHQHADVALDFVERHEGFTYTNAQERGVLRKIDMHLMPLMFVSYVIQYMDKSIMAQSAIYDLETSLGLKGQQYSWCSSIFYFGYLAWQPFSVRLLNYVPLGRFVSTTALAWAIILFCTAGAYNFTGMMIVRFFLGMAEGGISPAYVLITGTWYKKDEIPLRTTIWFCGNGLALILQSLICYGIGHIETKIATWRWFFIIFGLIGLVWAGVLWKLMPDTPLTAKFLTEEERVIAVERLRENRTGISNREFKKEQFIEALLDIKVWYAFLYNLTTVVPSTAVASFGSLIIKGFGYSSFHSSLLNMPLGAVEIVTLIITGTVTAHYPNMRCIMTIVCNIPAVVGSTCVYVLPEENKVGRLVAFYMVNFTDGSLPMLWSLTNSNIAGHTKRSTANAIQFVGYALAFIIGPQFFIASEAPNYPTGFKTMVVTFAIACVAPALYYALVTWENHVRVKKLRASGQADVYIKNEEFLDLTDKQQIHFEYSK